MCSVHPKKILDMFCSTDNIAICNLCLKLHKGHHTLDEEQIDETDKQMKVICSKVKEVIAKTSLSILKLKNEL